MQRPHVVQYQIFDVSFANADKSYELQNKISNIFHNELTHGMAELFDRLVPAERVVIFDELGINLGNIDYDVLDHDLARRLLAELEREIVYKLSLQTKNAIGENEAQYLKSFEATYSSFLEYFLLTGAIPWWATGELMTNPLKVMELILIKDTAGLKQLILRIGHNAYVRERLVYQFSEKIIYDIIIILEPAEAEFIFDYHINILKIHQQEKLVASADSGTFGKALWVFILTYILDDRGSLFNQKSFVKSTIGQMAQHYNRNYIELLSLLENALVSAGFTDKQSNRLALIINDLSFQEFDNENIKKSKIIGEINNSDAIQQDIELIGHYLVFGSLPWWSEPYTNDRIAVMLLGLIRSVPGAMKKLIMDTGQNEGTRKRITSVFEEEVITGIIKLLEPGNAGFIFKYVAEVQVVHRTKPVIQTDERGFKKTVWGFVFDFLLLEKESVFNQRTFLERNIASLAHHYNVRYSDMLLFMTQSIAQMHQDSVDHTPMLRLLTELLTDFNEHSALHNSPGSAAGQQLSGENGLRKVVLLKDILLHWINYGNIPWWGGEYFDLGPAAMLESLLLSSPEDALRLLNYAGTQPDFRRRIIYHLPVQLFLDIFRYYPGGNEAIKYYQHVLKAFLKVDETKRNDEPARFLLAILWDIYIATQYQAFNNANFIVNGLYALAAQFNVEKQAISSVLRRQFNRSELKFYSEILNALPDQDTIYVQALKEQHIYTLHGKSVLQLIASHLPPNKQQKEGILDEALRLLEHFLSSGKLSASFKNAHTSQVLKQLLLLLHYERPAALDNLLQQEGHLATARLQLHNAFGTTINIAENGVSRILKTYFEKDILLYLKQVPGIDFKSDDGFSVIMDKYLIHPKEYYPLISSLLKHAAVARHIGRHYTDAVMYDLLHKSPGIINAPETVTWLNDLQSLIMRNMSDTLQRIRFNTLLREFNLLLLGDHFSAGNLEGYIKQFLNFISSQNHSLFIALSGVLVKNGNSGNVSLSFKAKLPLVLSELRIHGAHHQSIETIKSSLTQADDEAFQKATGLNDAKQKSIEAEQLKDELKRRQREAEEILKKKNKKLLVNTEDTIYINNAGLVLLNPFLATYFIRLGMLEGGQFISDESRARAVHLLQYLVDGTHQNTEHILVLNKILCNMPVEEPIPLEIILSEKEKRVSDELLKAVLNNWDKVKNTNVRSFQGSFLQRTGALVYKDDAWNLKVEQRGYDVLLQTLPWTIGMIKTSWMNNFLYVEWI